MTTYPAKKKIGKLGAVGIAATITVLLCCGAGAIGALTDSDGDKKPVAAATAGTAATTTASDATDRIVDGVSPTAGAQPSATPAPALSPTPAPKRTSGTPTSRPVVKPTTSKPKPKPTTAAPKPTTAKPKPPAVSTVHPGAFCSKQGARGVTKTGKPMVCTTTAADPKKRWRAA
ncbi:hypothetical protein ACGGAQ_32160 [Micromonospora sp. NPDC047557]|uniref:hypothetical protein n=1 Tax=Micromonospora sp. NPDC047557 TaxID=3364250 RepID=UPI00371FE2C1